MPPKKKPAAKKKDDADEQATSGGDEGEKGVNKGWLEKIGDSASAALGRKPSSGDVAAAASGAAAAGTSTRQVAALR